MLFFYHNNIITLSPDIRVHRAGSQLKTITIFAYKQLGLSIDIETFVQHVPSPKESNLATWQPDNPTTWHFWALTWKQKLFSMIITMMITIMRTMITGMITMMLEP